MPLGRPKGFKVSQETKEKLSKLQTLEVRQASSERMKALWAKQKALTEEGKT